MLPPGRQPEIGANTLGRSESYEVSKRRGADTSVPGWRPEVAGSGCLMAEAFDPVLLVGGDLAGERQPRIEAAMRDGDEGFAMLVGAEVEPADDAAFVACVVEAGDGALGRHRRSGVLA